MALDAPDRRSLRSLIASRVPSRSLPLALAVLALACEPPAPPAEDRAPSAAVEVAPSPLPARWQAALDASSSALRITLYLGADLVSDPRDAGPRIACLERGLRSLAAGSGGRLSFERRVVDSPEAERAARAAGVAPSLERLTSSTIETSYFAFVVASEGASVVVDRFEPGPVMDRALGRALARVAGIPVRIGLLEGRGVGATARPLGLEVVEVARGAEPPADLAALYVVAPEPPLTALDVAALDAFLARGGAVAVFDRGVELRGAAATAPRTSGLDPWLASHGISMAATIVADERCTAIPIDGPLAVPFPPGVLPSATARALGAGEPPRLLFASPVEAAATAGATTLWTSSPASWRLGAPPFELRHRADAVWAPPAGSARAAEPLAVLVETAHGGRLLVVGSSSPFDPEQTTAAGWEPIAALTDAVFASVEPSTALAACP